MTLERRTGQPAATNLVDILDRVLDKGLVVAGDIRISLANVELLTIQIRLLVCSIDKAQEVGLDWWRRDRFLSSGAEGEAEAIAALRARIEALESQVGPSQGTGRSRTQKGTEGAQRGRTQSAKGAQRSRPRKSGKQG